MTSRIRSSMGTSTRLRGCTMTSMPSPAVRLHTCGPSPELLRGWSPEHQWGSMRGRLGHQRAARAVACLHVEDGDRIVEVGEQVGAERQYPGARPRSEQGGGSRGARVRRRQKGSRRGGQIPGQGEDTGGMGRPWSRERPPAGQARKHRDTAGARESVGRRGKRRRRVTFSIGEWRCRGGES